MARPGARLRAVACTPRFTAAPTITGTAKSGMTLTSAATVTAGTVTARQWRRNGTAIGGATAATYVCQAADIGATITVAVTATSSLNPATTTTAISAPTVAVVA